MIEHIAFSNDAAEDVGAIVANLIAVEPEALPYLVHAYATIVNSHGWEPSRHLKPVLSNVICERAPLNQSNIVTWALWSAGAFGVQLEEPVANAVAESEDVCTIIMALACQDAGLLKTKLVVDGWNSLLDSNCWTGEYWLLAYEASRREWLSPKGLPGVLESNDELGSLLENDVSFFDDSEFGHAEGDLVARVPRIDPAWRSLLSAYGGPEDDLPF